MILFIAGAAALLLLELAILFLWMLYEARPWRV